MFVLLAMLLYMLLPMLVLLPNEIMLVLLATLRRAVLNIMVGFELKLSSWSSLVSVVHL